MNLSRQIDIIREFINNPRKQHELLKKIDNWNMLCTALDTIGDTDMATDAYIARKDTDSYGDRYLTAYGILQVLYVQQDSVEYLHKALNMPYTRDATLRDIREIRNDSVGHPIRTDRGKKPIAFNFITRISLTRRGFSLIKTFTDRRDPQFKNVDMMELVKKQRLIHHSMLSNIVKTLRKEDMKHKKKFGKEKLENIFPPTLSYFIEKIIETIHGGKPASFGAVHTKIITDCLDKFKTALKARGIYEAYDTVKYEIELLEYPIKELDLFFEDSKKSHINQKDAYIFAFFIKKHLEVLKEIATEIDKEYSSV